MIKFVFVFIFAYCSAQNTPLIGRDFNQHYSRIRLFEYDSYSDAKFLKFTINGPTTLANWSLTTSNEGKCPDQFANIHFYLQYGAYPLTTPRNESFPQGYITSRHHLFKLIVNQTLANPLVQINSPLVGTWFAMAFIDRPTANIEPKIYNAGCNFYLSTWLDYEVTPIPLTLTLNNPIQLTLNIYKPSVYASYYTLPGNSRLAVVSEWPTNCDINILAKINSLPTVSLYDYKTVCKSKTCSIEIDQLSGYVWVYFQIIASNLSCLANPIDGHLVIQSRECLSSNSLCIQSFPTRRIMFNYYYDFLYVPIYTATRITAGSTSSIKIDGKDLSIYSYEFIIDDRNIGGTLHFDFESRIMPYVSSNVNVSVLGCISKFRPRLYEKCENDFRIFVEKNSMTIRSIPYPEMASWFLTLQYACDGSIYECANASLTLMFQISSSQCTKQQCGTYGVCRILTSQQNVFSTCTCLGGYRGYGCTDSTHAYASKNLSGVLFLTISNLMFLPGIILAIYRRLYIEALVYFFNMFFSTFYHACDQDLNKFCIFKYDGLQLSDFIGSYASFVITLITMAIIPRSTKVFLFMLGLLTCIVINSRDRFDHFQFIGLISVSFLFTIITWTIGSIRNRRLNPSSKDLLLYLPGFLLALAGLILYAFCETDENYWYTHSLWHIFIASSVLFFLPHQKSFNCQTTNCKLDININNESPSMVTSNPTLRPPIDDASLSSSNTDSSKKSTDNLLS